MSKIFICFAIILLFGLAGMIKADCYKKRVDLLNDITNIIALLSNEMEYSLEPLPIVFKKISGFNDKKFCDLLARVSMKLIEECDSFQSVWNESIDKVYYNSDLNDKDMEVLKDMGHSFGKSNIHGQSNMFKLAEKRMEIQLEEAISEKQTKGVLFQKLGFIIGIVIVILLI